MARKVRRASTVKKHRVDSKKRKSTSKSKDKRHLKVEIKVHHKY